MGAGSILGDITTIDHNIDAGGIPTSINGVHGAVSLNDPAKNAAIYPIECAAYIRSVQRILGCCFLSCVYYLVDCDLSIARVKSSARHSGCWQGERIRCQLGVICRFADFHRAADGIVAKVDG